MKEVLEETHGVMVYQEQVMRILNRLGGISLPNAYTCIKAISKKKLELIAQYHEAFIKGATEKGLGKSEASELFEMIKHFAGYGFNKSHSTAYALIAYMTAYLKAHYPLEFMAALLSGDIDAQLQEERLARRAPRGLPANEHRRRSARRQSVGRRFRRRRQQDLRGAVRHQRLRQVGRGKPWWPRAAPAGRFATSSICASVSIRPHVSRATIETLIKAGALDSSGAKRSQHMAAVEHAMQSGAAMHADRRSGQKGLFDMFDDAQATAAPAAATLPDMPEWDSRQCLACEKEVLGFYLTSHPLAEHETTLATYRTHMISDVPKLAHDRRHDRRHAVVHQDLAAKMHARGNEHEVRDVRPGGHRPRQSAASPGPSSSPSSAT